MTRYAITEHDGRAYCAPVATPVPPLAPCACGADAVTLLRGPGGTTPMCAKCFSAFYGFAAAMREVP